MKHPETRKLYDYWNSLRLSRSAPLRSDINPREIKTLLPRLFILQRETERSYRYRLAGTDLCRFFDGELRDRNFLADWQDNERASMVSLFQSITEEKSAAVLGVKANDGDYNECQMEYLLVPVRLDGSSEVRIIGCVGIFEPCAWLGRTPIQHQEITGLRLLRPDEAPRFLEHRQDALCEPAETVATASAPEGAERHGHLWVIDGGAAR